MKLNRREMLLLSGAASLTGIETNCIRRRPEATVLSSRIRQPSPFQTPLPMPPVLQPVRTDQTTDYYEVVARAASAQILPGVATGIWGYNGSFPGPTFDVRSGRRVVVHLENALPVPIVNHLHGGHTAPESDGYPTDLVLPSGGFDQPHMHDRAARITEGSREYVYTNDQRAATLWYHDHRMDFTAPQVWRGLAGFYIIRDTEEDRLPLPRGDKEIPLLICDRSFDADGSFLYPAIDPGLRTHGVSPEYMGGVLGDVILVNGAPWPKLEVANTRYRFRVLNASNARRYELALDPAPRGESSFVQIGSDGGLLSSPITHRTIRIAPAERFDLVVDFSKYQPGSIVTLRNDADQGATGEIMQFHFTRQQHDSSMIPSRLSAFASLDPADAIETRRFDFSYQRASKTWTINGQPFDPARMDARPLFGTTEIWRFQTDFSHPLHLHLVHFQVISHSGRPGPFDAGWKDTIDLFPGQTANILVHFGGYRGRYVFHCHNLEHEDMAMMGNFEVV